MQFAIIVGVIIHFDKHFLHTLCMKKMFVYTRRDSTTDGVFLDLSLPTLDAVVHSLTLLFALQTSPLDHVTMVFTRDSCTGRYC